MLYGIERAKRDIARQHQAVVVEGYTDVMACHLAGVTTAVASCGTAFGAEHISVLRRLLMDQDEFRGEVVYTFDGDAAGQEAAMKAFGEDQRFVGADVRRRRARRAAIPASCGRSTATPPSATWSPGAPR